MTTLGVEEEFHLIDPETAELTPSINELHIKIVFLQENP
ncbi:MAG: Carboxylate-amine ligase YbdK [Candidatus Scalindua rubra]|uniref:Carboxylate-amine ligase YbdK n=1 Tax=Candidatus Scalindua rubra TaxID=1872076 RepID=A0A1E3X6G4_9BACT|nr:MAG: Carboxylate-amine ligase YbdK [Candidatus Scalindua rubra]